MTNAPDGPAAPPPTHAPVNMMAEVGEILPFLDQRHRHPLCYELQERLEQLTGSELTRDLSDEESSELDWFIDQDMEHVYGWLASNLPGYEAFDEFKEALAADPAADRDEVVADFAARRWLVLRRPDYPEVVRFQLALLLQATQQVREEVGEDALRAWSTTQNWLIPALHWAEVPQQAAGRLASRIVEDNGVAIVRWAHVHEALQSLSTRVAALRSEVLGIQ